MPYTPFGPWVDGAAPGIQATFLNPLEAFLASVNSASTDSTISSDGAGKLNIKSLNPTDATTIAGTTSGSATVYQFLQGTCKGFLLYLNNYRNASVTDQKITLPTAITARCLYLAGNITNVGIYNGGSAILNQCAGVNALSASGGTVGGYSSLHTYDFGEITSPFDQLSLGNSQASATTGTCIFFGV